MSVGTDTEVRPTIASESSEAGARLGTGLNDLDRFRHRILFLKGVH